MDTPGVPNVGDLIEKGQQSAVNTTKAAVSDVANSVSGQIGIKNETNSAQTQSPIQNPNQNVPAPEASNQTNQQDQEATKDMVRDYYSPSQTISNASQAELAEQQRQAKLLDVRQKLALERHNEEYFNEIRDAGTSKPQAQVGAQEAEIQEKKMEDLQTQQRKDIDIAKFKAERRVEIPSGPVG